MNEIVYNILRKCVESPEKVKYELRNGKHCNFHHIYINGYEVVRLIECKLVDSILPQGMKFKLTEKECRRILRGMEHVESIKIRGL